MLEYLLLVVQHPENVSITQCLLLITVLPLQLLPQVEIEPSPLVNQLASLELALIPMDGLLIISGDREVALEHFCHLTVLLIELSTPQELTESISEFETMTELGQLIVQVG